MKKSFNKRKAIACKMISRSKSNPGYFKYEVTVAGVDNKKTMHPVYGKDMQNALSRLMYQEKTKWFEAKMSAGWILLLYALLVVVPTAISDVQPAGLLCSLGSTILIISLLVLWNKYLERGQ